MEPASRPVPPPGSLYDPTVAGLVRAAARRLTGTLARETPTLGARVLPWLASLSETEDLADYFMHPRRFPMLLLPWWAVEGAESGEDLAFHEDLALSTMAGYCYIRLIDDLADGRGTPGLDLLPAAGVFHLEFMAAYLRHFPADSPVWKVFRAQWLAGAEAAVPPRHADATRLEARAEATLGPVLIPVAAACHHAGVPARFDAWRPVLLELARVEQFLDDLLDWQDDADRAQPNLLLAEAAQRMRPGEAVTTWIVREGYGWALATAAGRLAAAARAVERLGSSGLARFVALRRAQVEQLATDTGPGLRHLTDLARLFGSAAP